MKFKIHYKYLIKKHWLLESYELSKILNLYIGSIFYPAPIEKIIKKFIIILLIKNTKII